MVWSEFWAQYSALLGTGADPVVAAPEQSTSYNHHADNDYWEGRKLENKLKNRASTE